MHIEENVSLAPFTTLQIGGPARYFCRVTEESEIAPAIDFARRRNLPIFAMGGGSNLVVADMGFPGLVLHVALAASIARTDVEKEVFFDVSAGTDWDTFVLAVCRQGVCGVECLAGIPGLTGGAPIQNIGAYGQEAAQSIQSVRVFDLQAASPGNAWKTLSHQQCAFGYRQSIFNSGGRDRYIVGGVRFRLERDAVPNLGYADLSPLRETNPSALDVYHFVRDVRERKGMLIDPTAPRPDTRSAGSFFKNPVVSPKVLAAILGTLREEERQIPHWAQPSGQMKLGAAWLIEQAGFLKGFSLGRVGISSRHTLALVNRSGDATCADLLQLRDLIVLTVEQRFGVTLEQEPVFVRLARASAEQRA